MTDCTCLMLRFITTWPLSRAVAVCLALSVLVGCASNPPNGPVYDPLENVNRKVYAFNTKVDNVVLKPVARGYRAITPDFVETGIRNFFGNLDEVTVIVNDLLQGKLLRAANDTGRFVINTVSFLGFIDIASEMGLEKHNETFGQTLGVWGIGEGPFIMLPFFGPANARTAVGDQLIERFTTSWALAIDDRDTATGMAIVDLISLRASLLEAGNVFDAAAIDPYLMLRDFRVLTHRRATWEGKRPVGIGQSSDLGDIDELDELMNLMNLMNLMSRTNLIGWMNWSRRMKHRIIPIHRKWQKPFLSPLSRP